MKHPTAAFSLVLVTILPAASAAQQPAPALADGTVVIEAAALKWNPLELPGFAPGLMLAAIHGNPEKAEAYTIRLRFPDGYAFPAHFHPNAENLTVLSGTFKVGHGATPTDAVKAYVPGDYLYIPGGMPHFGRVEGETVIQLHGMGPFDVKLAQPPGSAKQ